MTEERHFLDLMIQDIAADIGRFLTQQSSFGCGRYGQLSGAVYMELARNGHMAAPAMSRCGAKRGERIAAVVSPHVAPADHDAPSVR